MQSLVIVLLKMTLINVQAIAMQNGSPNSGSQEAGQQSAFPKTKSNNNLAQANGGNGADGSITVEELDNMRLREISHKAISGALIIMLKWFKISRKSTSIWLQLGLICNRCAEIRVPDAIIA